LVSGAGRRYASKRPKPNTDAMNDGDWKDKRACDQKTPCGGRKARYDMCQPSTDKDENYQTLHFILP